MLSYFLDYIGISVPFGLWFCFISSCGWWYYVGFSLVLTSQTAFSTNLFMKNKNGEEIKWRLVLWSLCPYFQLRPGVGQTSLRLIVTPFKLDAHCHKDHPYAGYSFLLFPASTRSLVSPLMLIRFLLPKWDGMGFTSYFSKSLVLTVDPMQKV